MNDLGNRIKQLRINRQLNQTQLAKLLSCSSSVVSAYEANVRKPSLDNLASLARIFNVSTDYILGNPSRDPNLVDISALTDSQRISIKQLIESIKKK
jgi:DNA phosphorothioation-dependent restriction protein DptG